MKWLNLPQQASPEVLYIPRVNILSVAHAVILLPIQRPCSEGDRMDLHGTGSEPQSRL